MVLEGYRDDSPVGGAFSFCRTAPRRTYDGNSVVYKARSVRVSVSVKSKSRKCVILDHLLNDIPRELAHTSAAEFLHDPAAVGLRGHWQI